MKKFILATLAAANLAMVVAIISTLTTTHATQLAVSDLWYGMMDTDGDGEYTIADDIAVHWLLENSPHHIDEALKAARVNADGGVDLSPYLVTVRKN